MAEPYKISVRVIEKKGTCPEEHKIGDQWVIGGKTPEGLCLTALSVLFPRLQVLRFGGAFPWQTDPDMTTVSCPDAANHIVFELRRLHE